MASGSSPRSMASCLGDRFGFGSIGFHFGGENIRKKARIGCHRGIGRETGQQMIYGWQLIWKINYYINGCPRVHPLHVLFIRSVNPIL